MDRLSSKSPPAAVIYGLSGLALTAEEKDFFQDTNPLGFILFSRNCETPEQLKALTDSLQDCLGRGVPILIDQEGGRVQRLKSPHWAQYPAAREMTEKGMKPRTSPISAQQRVGDDPGSLSRGPGSSPGVSEDFKKNYGTLARELYSHGINVNCAPVLDVLTPQTDHSIGDRAFSGDPDEVAACGKAVCEAFLENGVIPVMKHLPGLGRPALDTHEALPGIEASIEEMERTDFAPFRALAQAPFAAAVWGMVGHALYKKIDEKNPASCSSKIIKSIIRDHIGFEGLLLSDDLSMGALSGCGEAQERAASVLEAGCDIALHCNGVLEEMRAVADRVPSMTEKAVERYNNSVETLAKTDASLLS